VDRPDLLVRLDAAIHELQAIRHELAGQVHLPAPTAAEIGPNLDRSNDPDDLADMLDTTSAAARLNYPTDTIRKWCREGAGRKIGGRWMASVPRLKARLNGKA
jgi:hypothetical protein